MADNHPITPPPELVQQLRNEAPHNIRDTSITRELHLITAAARWGADQELEACCEWLVIEGWFRYEHAALCQLRAARRPKPPSLRQQALAVIENSEICDHLSTEHAAILRRALEQLDD
jgi:hypothetical protein